MTEPAKKKRIRAADLRKDARRLGESKYDFSKIIHLKGNEGRDVTKKGRPEGVQSSSFESEASGSHQMTNEVDTVGTSITNPIGEIDIQINSEAVPHDEPPTVHEFESTLLPEEAYSNLLKENNGLFCIDDNYQKFALQDFDCRRSALKAAQFVFVSRRVMTFLDEPHWIYKCSCDLVAAELVDCCGDRMEVSYDGFIERIPGCIHTTTTSAIMEQFDAQNLIDPVLSSGIECDNDEEEEESTVDGNNEDVKKLTDGLFIVKCGKEPGIVQQTGEGVKCLTCNCSVNRCIHLHKFYGVFGEEERLKTEKSNYKQKCYSSIKIPFYSSEDMQDMYKKPISERFAGDNIIKLKPEIDICDACGQVLEESVEKKSNLFVMNQILEANVSSKKCSGCLKEFYFDGFSHCVLNMGRNIYCHEILRRFSYYFLSGKSTIFTEYQVLRKTFVDAGYTNFEEKMAYQDFKSAWYAFLELLDIDYDTSFQCPYCGPDPDTVVMDATSVAFRKELICWKSLFASETHNSVKPCDTYDSDRVRERTFFSTTVRKILTDYLKPSRGISKDEKEKMYNIIKAETEDNNILDLICLIINDSVIRGDRFFARDVWRDLIKVFKSPNPACGFFPPSEEFFQFFHDALSCKEKLLSDDMKLSGIQNYLPVIFRLITNLKSNFPYEQFIKCLHFFQQKTFDPFLKEPVPSETPDEEDRLSYFPQLQQQRNRGFFVADKKGTKRKEDLCSKFSKGHPSLLPGVFTMFCPHGFCYGFQVMKLHESPNVPFTLLRTRFAKAPKLVVYDNACSLHTYCLNRDPVFFRDTSFRVDALHFKNHKACGPGYELKRYPLYVHLNSQVVEQANSRLQRIKGSLSYMTQTNFMKHCKFYLWGQNEEVLSKF